MKLYDVNQQLEELLLQLEPDPETGEIPSNEDEILEQINSLAMQKMEILQYLAKLALNVKSEAEALKQEEKRLKSRRERLDHRHMNLISLLDRECGGVKTDLGVATLSYRKSSRVEIADPRSVYDWLVENKHSDCIHVPEPELSKSGVGKLLDAGERIPGAEKIVSMSCYLR